MMQQLALPLGGGRMRRNPLPKPLGAMTRWGDLTLTGPTGRSRHLRGPEAARFTRSMRADMPTRVDGKPVRYRNVTVFEGGGATVETAMPIMSRVTFNRNPPAGINPVAWFAPQILTFGAIGAAMWFGYGWLRGRGNVDLGDKGAPGFAWNSIENTLTAINENQIIARGVPSVGAAVLIAKRWISTAGLPASAGSSGASSARAPAGAGSGWSPAVDLAGYGFPGFAYEPTFLDGNASGHVIRFRDGRAATSGDTSATWDTLQAAVRYMGANADYETRMFG